MLKKSILIKSFVAATFISGGLQAHSLGNVYDFSDKFADAFVIAEDRNKIVDDWCESIQAAARTPRQTTEIMNALEETTALLYLACKLNPLIQKETKKRIIELYSEYNLTLSTLVLSRAKRLLAQFLQTDDYFKVQLLLIIQKNEDWNERVKSELSQMLINAGVPQRHVFD